MNRTDELLNTPLRAAINTSRKHHVIMVRDMQAPKWQYAPERMRPLVYFELRPDKGWWVPSLAVFPDPDLHLDPDAWQPLTRWPVGWPFGDKPTRPPIRSR